MREETGNLAPTRSQDSRTRMIVRRAPALYDGAVRSVIVGLPRAESGHTFCSVGIANEQGHVYREVWLFSALELLEFTARMNAAGFALHRGTRGAASSTYRTVFWRPRRIKRFDA
ncbi:hypothetical protein [Ramlibacter sp. AN1133]|uniref:hypothetical protein n=1 Tax=Ramlibacter sp. AN1133 TaxID=3133429 RepID=UPI0030BAE30A